MSTNRLLSVTLCTFALSACYNPNIAPGKQQCGPGGQCATGETCAANNYCYPTGMTVTCAPKCSGVTPVCDQLTLTCVGCLADSDCGTGEVCRNKVCATGCNAGHSSCGPDAGSCDVDMGLCRGCLSDGECGGATPRCETTNGVCVACLLTNDNCAAGEYCSVTAGVYGCKSGCKSTGDCTFPGGSDGGVAPIPSCCANQCANLTNDDNNCGSCGKSCGGGGSCCAGACTNFQSDTMNCGSCGFACAAANVGGALCTNAACDYTTCNSGFGDCDGNRANGCETNLQSDAANCNGCGMVCPTAPNSTPSCVMGACAIGGCSPGFADCDANVANGCEVNTTSDINNCNGCSMACPTPANGVAICLQSACGLASCNTGFADCDSNPANGCEVNIETPANCGGCGKVCTAFNATPSCVNQTCAIASCNTGFFDCDAMAADGCEINGATDPKNCGMCGKVCALPNATPGCAASACTVGTCNAGYADCNHLAADGCEVNTTNDAKNCNGCNIACPANQVCSAGKCGAASATVMVLFGALSAPTYGADVVTKLKGTGAFGAVDLFNGNTTVPTLQNLQAYTAVLVATDGGGFSDPVATGNALADYWDAGGKVVLAVFSNASIAVTGRFGTAANGYMLITAAGQNEPSATLGTVNEPNSPLMNGVTTFAATSAYMSTGTLINGGIVTAAWSNGAPLIIRGVVKGRNMVSLNMYPVSSTEGGGFWTGNGDLIMRNALLF